MILNAYYGRSTTSYKTLATVTNIVKSLEARSIPRAITWRGE